MSSRLPRGARAPAVLLAAMLVATALGWGLFVHNPAPERPDRPGFLSAPGESLPAPAENQSYRVTVKMETNDPGAGGLVVRQKEYVPGKHPVVKDSQVATNGDVVQYVTYRNGQRRYVRKTYDDARSFQAHAGDPGVTRTDRTSLTHYSRGDARRSAATIDPQRALRTLYMLRYEKRGTTRYQGRTVVRYVPVTGWTTTASLDGSDSVQSVYVRQADGQVLVDPADGAILKANVSGAVIQASNWAGVMTGDARSVSVRYEVDTGIEQVSQPPWVSTLNDSGNVEPSVDGKRVDLHSDGSTTVRQQSVENEQPA